jgi:hypothetical protein
MKKRIYFVISDCGDGSNAINWVLDYEVIEKMREIAESGDSQYSSSEGLQEYSLEFPEDFDIDAWIKANYIYINTMEDVESF